MKMIHIYGPPAAGKLTIAKELAKITGYKIFHNHMANDIVAPFVECDTGDFWNYVTKIKKVIYGIALKENINLISTGCYEKELDDSGMKRKIKLFEKNRSKVLFVRIICDRKNLINRVSKKSRKEHRKISSVSKLNRVLNKYDLEREIPFVKNFTVDNTNMPAKKVAKLIKEHYKLK
jgi:cytidylate kinase